MERALELSRVYWNTIAAPEFKRAFPQIFPRIAAGLCGNGSECFGYDDEVSRDHDWGIDFFLWVSEADREYIPVLKQWKEELFRKYPPKYPRWRSTHGGTVDVMTIGDFYASLIGVPGVPDDILKWRWAPEENYALAVNGEVFWDGLGEFSRIRNELLNYYPEDLRRKKIAARCMMISQTGQYNFARIAGRKDWIAVRFVLAKFSMEAAGLVYHLNRVYRPYYKWTWHRLRELPILGREAADLLLEIAEEAALDENTRIRMQEKIEKLCALMAEELRRQGLSDSDDWYFSSHGEAVQQTIQHEQLRRLPAQYE